MSDLDIAEVARRSGLPASTLRFYEEKGLIASTGRRGLRRLFAPDVLERLALIALGQSAGFALDELRVILAPTAHRQSDGQSQSDGQVQSEGQSQSDGQSQADGWSRGANRPRIDRKLLAAKADELDRTILRLTAMRDGLRHAAACPAPSHFACPSFRRLLQTALQAPTPSRRKRAP
jgi:DNA-binding transcriptional MerR regulator